MRKPWLAPLLATTLSLAAAGPASAGHGWQTGSLVTPPYNQVTALHADVDLVGNTLAVWRDDKSGSLLYRERPYAGTFADAPAVITQATVHDEVLAGDRHGNAVVAYWADGAIWASFKATGQPFAAPQRVASSPGEARIVASFGANGDAVVAWTEIDGTASVVRASVRRAAQPAFDAPVQLGTGAMVDASAQDDAGNGLVVWTQADGMRIARHPAGGGFLPPQTIAVDGPVVELKLAVGLDGRALLGYSEAPGGGVDAAHVAVATGTTTTGLGERRIVSGPFARDVDVALGNAIALQGAPPAATVTWRAASGRNSRVQATYAPDATTFEPTQTLSGRNARLPRASVNRDNAAAVAWQRHTSGGRSIESATRRPDAAHFTPAARLSGYGTSEPSMVAAARGDFFVAWTRNAGDISRVESTRLRRTGRGGGVVTVFAARVASGERVDALDLFPQGAGAIAIYRRAISKASRLFWDLATYDEQRPAQ